MAYCPHHGRVKYVESDYMDSTGFPRCPRSGVLLGPPDDPTEHMCFVNYYSCGCLYHIETATWIPHQGDAP